MKNALWAILVIFAIVIVFVIVTPQSSPGCFETERQEAIPSQFQNSVLMFDSSTTAYYDPPLTAIGCSPTVKSLKGGVSAFASDEGLQTIPPGTTFKVVNRVHVNCDSLICALENFGGSWPTEVVVIQDNAGNNWQLDLPFGSTGSSTFGEIAYYINGKKIGYVSASDFNQ
jgi:hypothetical protein